MNGIFFAAVGATLAFALVYLVRRLTSFSSQKPDDFAGQGPEFDLRKELNGDILCEGVIYGPTGKISSRFVADMHAKWDGNVGRMTERFVYDNGDTQDREWTLTMGNDGSVKATAPDVVGTGHGRAVGPAFLMNYKFKLPKASGGHVLDTVDWMYLVESGSIINRSQFRKYGIKVAEIVATMRRKETA
ncbi:DUF3833 domain-containing protein [Algirhabdus cladophorae]|uniref:DUF3833 domain-containing protein n=1 Tax=Algirhabdus cladophorae TaxID=3377108 RepID=UPI003B849566